MIEKKDVTGKAAFNYLIQELEKGGVFSAFIKALPLNDGMVFALVPAGTSSDKLYNFGNGGLYDFDEGLLREKHVAPIQNEARPFLIKEVQNHLELSESSCCLFEDPIRSSTDPIVGASVIEYIHLSGGEMFYFFNQDNSNFDTKHRPLVTSED